MQNAIEWFGVTRRFQARRSVLHGRPARSSHLVKHVASRDEFALFDRSTLASPHPEASESAPPQASVATNGRGGNRRCCRDFRRNWRREAIIEGLGAGGL
jgi:hypothetical protein